jgi:hypothetical protein
MHPYNDLNDIIPARIWAISEVAVEAEARLFVPHQIYVSCMTLTEADTKRKLASALKTLGFDGQLDWREA